MPVLFNPSKFYIKYNACVKGTYLCDVNNEHQIFSNPTHAMNHCFEQNLTNYAIEKKRNGYYIKYDIEKKKWTLYKPKLKGYYTDLRANRITYIPKNQFNRNLIGMSIIGATAGIAFGVGPIIGATTGAAIGGIMQSTSEFEIVEKPSQSELREIETINNTDIVHLLQQNTEKVNELNTQSLDNLIRNTSLDNYEHDKKINYNDSIPNSWRRIIRRGLRIGRINGIKQKNGDPYKPNHWANRMNRCTDVYVERIYNPTNITKGIKAGETELSLTDIDKHEFENMSIKEILSYLKSHIKIDQKWKRAWGGGNGVGYNDVRGVGYYLNESKQLLKWMIITFIIILEN
jgi:hypothetical protein